MRDERRFLDPQVLSRIARMDLIARFIVEGFIIGLHKSPFHGFSVEFNDYRPYMPGDELKHIDWKVYAKTDRYFIKRYEAETNVTCYILLDCSASMGYQSKGISKFRYGCYLAAALSYLMVRQQDLVSLVAFDDKVITYAPPQSNSAHLQGLLRTLETLEVGKKTNVSKALRDLAETIKKRGLIILISDLLDDPEKVLSGLRCLRHMKNETIVFQVLDEAELTFPFERMTQFRDMETGGRLLVMPESIRTEYLARIKDFIDFYKRECREDLIDFISLNTSQPFDYAMTSYLLKRAKAG